MTEGDTETARRHFAETLRATAPIQRNKRVVDAFATVPRERFLGPGPWRILPGLRLDAAYMTPDDDPRRLYHDVLVVIDEARHLNNGQPSLWAYLLDLLDLKPGERILQVGAGTGYYSAILAEIVGPEGRVVAVEYDAELASRARHSLAPWPQAEVVTGDGTTHDPGPVDVVITFAGSTHPAPLWLERLREGGRLLMALTGEAWWGFLLRVERGGDRFAASSLGSVGIFPCAGGRDAEASKRLGAVLRRLRGGPVPVTALHRGAPPARRRSVWYWGPGFWLERAQAPAGSRTK
jgi:protein-L-isoaspartate(D-aspartate) O-methyltransferase